MTTVTHKRTVRALWVLFWVALILYAATADAKPRHPYDAKYRGWYSLPVGAHGQWFTLDAGDSVWIPPVDPRFVGVLFIAPRQSSFLRGRVRANLPKKNPEARDHVGEVPPGSLE